MFQIFISHFLCFWFLGKMLIPLNPITRTLFLTTPNPPPPRKKFVKNWKKKNEKFEFDFSPRSTRLKIWLWFGITKYMTLNKNPPWKNLLQLSHRPEKWWDIYYPMKGVNFWNLLNSRETLAKGILGRWFQF